MKLASSGYFLKASWMIGCIWLIKGRDELQMIGVQVSETGLEEFRSRNELPFIELGKI